MLLSEDIDSSDGIAKSRYLDKLKHLGLAATDNPYASDDFRMPVQLWPPVEFGHIFCYFIVCPGVHMIYSNGGSSNRTTISKVVLSGPLEVWDLTNGRQCIILKNLVYLAQILYTIPGRRMEM